PDDLSRQGVREILARVQVRRHEHAGSGRGSSQVIVNLQRSLSRQADDDGRRGVQTGFLAFLGSGHFLSLFLLRGRVRSRTAVAAGCACATAAVADNRTAVATAVAAAVAATAASAAAMEQPAVAAAVATA